MPRCRWIKQGGRRKISGAALSVRPGGQEVTRPGSATRSLGSLHAFAAGLVGIGFRHALGLLVAHRHLALRRRGLRGETGLHERLALVTLLVCRLFIAGLHLVLLRI